MLRIIINILWSFHKTLEYLPPLEIGLMNTYRSLKFAYKIFFINWAWSVSWADLKLIFGLELGFRFMPNADRSNI